MGSSQEGRIGAGGVAGAVPQTRVGRAQAAGPRPGSAQVLRPLFPSSFLPFFPHASGHQWVRGAALGAASVCVALEGVWTPLRSLPGRDWVHGDGMGMALGMGVEMGIGDGDGTGDGDAVFSCGVGSKQHHPGAVTG